MVKFMKKYVILFIILITSLSIKNTKEKLVFNNIDLVDSYLIELNINTNNLSCISKLNIHSVEIDINPVYKIDKTFYYKNTNIFIKDVINRLKEKGYTIKANKYLIEPIYIKRVLFYNKKSKIIDVLNECNIKINT